MLVSIDWLREYVDINENFHDLADLLTMLGHEAEHFDKPDFSYDIITAVVNEVKNHPKANNLKICIVNDSKKDFNVICGAPNVKAGQKVVFAKIGSTLPGEIKIQKKKIRGVFSEGMLCSEMELGISNEHEGIITLPDDTIPGISYTEYWKNSISGLELDITPNRPDALSHIGLARDISVKTGRKLTLPAVKKIKQSDVKEDVNIIIDDPSACPRYIAGVVKGINVGPAPDWMVNYLEAAGQRSINNIVDISNFVLLEMGHPTHIFDFNLLPTKTIRVRRAKKGELFITLDEEKHILNPEHLLITDGKKPIALAGIMGGLNTAVNEETKKVLIESAYFDPVTIRKGSKSLSILSEASRRFERGADPEATVTAFTRVVELLEKYAGGSLVSDMIDVYPNPIISPTIILREIRVAELTGCKISEDFIETTLSGLGVNIKKSGTGEWTCIPPTFRPDLEREVDLIEEIIRLYGYDNIPSSNRFVSVFDESGEDPYRYLEKIYGYLSGLGFHQCYNNSLQSEDLASASQLNPIKIMNPLSRQLANVRTSLLPGLLWNIDINIKVGNSDLMLFEIGQVHEKRGEGLTGIVERSIISGVTHGNLATSDLYHNTDIHHDYFILKGYVSSFLNLINPAKTVFVKFEDKEFDHCVHILLNDEVIGVMGEVKQSYIKKMGFEIGPTFGFTLDQTILIKYLKKTISYHQVPVYPSIIRDLNFVVADNVRVGDIINTISPIGKGIIKNIEPLNIYKHESLGDGNKSVLFQLIFQDNNKTLEDITVNEIISEVISMISKQYDAKLRA
jgi:phenylalanyl-tRNA synthetase beta chain